MGFQSSDQFWLGHSRERNEQWKRKAVQFSRKHQSSAATDGHLSGPRFIAHADADATSGDTDSNSNSDPAKSNAYRHTTFNADTDSAESNTHGNANFHPDADSAHSNSNGHSIFNAASCNSHSVLDATGSNSLGDTYAAPADSNPNSGHTDTNLNADIHSDPHR